MLRRENSPPKRKQPQNAARNLAEIQRQNGRGNHVSSGFPQVCSNQLHAAFAFRQTEPALRLHTLALIPAILSPVSGPALPGATRCRTGEPDPVCLAIVGILSVPADFIRQNAAWLRCPCIGKQSGVPLPALRPGDRPGFLPQWLLSFRFMPAGCLKSARVICPLRQQSIEALRAQGFCCFPRA